MLCYSRKRPESFSRRVEIVLTLPCLTVQMIELFSSLLTHFSQAQLTGHNQMTSLQLHLFDLLNWVIITSHQHYNSSLSGRIIPIVTTATLGLSKRLVNTPLIPSSSSSTLNQSSRSIILSLLHLVSRSLNFLFTIKSPLNKHEISSAVALDLTKLLSGFKTDEVLGQEIEVRVLSLLDQIWSWQES